MNVFIAFKNNFTSLIYSCTNVFFMYEFSAYEEVSSQPFISMPGFLPAHLH